MFPFSGDGTDFTVRAVGNENKGVIPENLRNSVFIVTDVIVERGLQVLMDGFQFDKDQRNSIYKSDKVSTAFIHLTGNPELISQKIVVFLGIGPINNLDFNRDFFALFIGYFNLDAVF